MERPPKPRKADFADKRDFLAASATWAEQWNVWPWADEEDDDDQFVYDIADASHGG